MRAITIRTSLMMLIILASCTKNGLTGYDMKITSPRGSSLLPANGVIPTQRPDSINISEADIKSPADNVSNIYPQSIDSATASRIFQDVLAQGPNLWGNYFSDGQFVYTNAVRRYIERKYHLKCEKLFVFGKLTAVSLRYDCCASWNYDVTCVLRGKGGKIYTFDPRLFNSPVSGDVWVQAHTNATACVAEPDKEPFQQLVNGEMLHPTDLIPSGYYADVDYARTDRLLGFYADSVGCRNTVQSVL